MNRGNRREALAVAQAVHIDHRSCVGRRIRDCRDEDAIQELWNKGVASVGFNFANSPTGSQPLLHLLDVCELPRLFEKHLLRTVEAKDQEEVLARGPAP